MVAPCDMEDFGRMALDLGNTIDIGDAMCYGSGVGRGMPHASAISRG